MSTVFRKIAWLSVLLSALVILVSALVLNLSLAIDSHFKLLVNLTLVPALLSLAIALYVLRSAPAPSIPMASEAPSKSRVIVFWAVLVAKLTLAGVLFLIHG
jgi:hypothetical protein